MDKPKEDTEWQACQEAGEKPFEQKEEDNPFKKTLDSIVLGAYEQGKKDILSSVVERIEKVKESVQKQTGSFKYDDCYDDCIKIIKEMI